MIRPGRLTHARRGRIVVRSFTFRTGPRLRRRYQGLKILTAVVGIATVVAAAIALVIALDDSRRLRSLETGYNELGRRVTGLSDGSPTRQGDVPIGLPAGWARGGKLVVHTGQRPAALNPLLIQDVYARPVCDLVCETLARRDMDSMEFRPALAAEWEIAGDGLSFTFHLNPTARFSDGQPVTAEDVVFTFRMLRDARVRGPAGAAFLADLDDVWAEGPLTVTFRFARPYFLAFPAIADRYIVPRHVYDLADVRQMSAEPHRDTLVGSGPFVVQKQPFSLGDAIVLKRNDAYWDRANMAALDAVEFRVVEEDRRAFQLLQTGGVDMAYLSPEQYREAEKDENFRKYHRMFRYYTPSLGYVYVGWNNRREPFDDARVRLAMTHLTPRQAMVDEIYMGLARVVEVPFWSDGPQYPPEVTPTAFDPEAASRLLDEAGWRRDGGEGLRRRDGKPLKARILALKSEKRGTTLLDLLVEEAREAGVDLQVEDVAWPEMQARIDARDFDAVLMGWTAASEIDPYLFWHSSQAGRGGLNLVGFIHPEADRLVEAIRHEMDLGQRNRMCHELARLLAREQPYTMLLEPETLVAVGAKFRGARRYRLGLRLQEWYIPRGQ